MVLVKSISAVVVLYKKIIKDAIIISMDAVIKIIKSSSNVEAAKKALLSKKWKISKTNKLLKLISSEKSGTT